MSKDDKRTDSGIEVKALYTSNDLNGWDPATQLGDPGKPPYTRGVYPTMYRGKLWTMRQYAGFGSAASTNERFKFLLQAGQTGLSCAFDLPTQMGYDSDHPRAEGEVGKVGVAIDSLDDMRTLLGGLPLDQVSTRAEGRRVELPDPVRQGESSQTDVDDQLPSYPHRPQPSSEARLGRAHRRRTPPHVPATAGAQLPDQAGRRRVLYQRRCHRS